MPLMPFPTTKHTKKLHPPLLILIDGIELMLHKGVKRYVLIPMLINTLLFIALFSYGFQQMGELQGWVSSYLPSWLNWLGWLVWPIYFLAFWFFMTFLFIGIANIIASPFNAILSEKVEALRGYPSAPSGGAKEWLMLIPLTLIRELQKLLASLKWLLLMAILFFIPGLNILSFFIGAWLLAIQYLDCPADNQKVAFKQCLKQLQKNRWPALQFGMTVMVISLIPIINFLIIPAAVAAATCLWHEQYAGNKPYNADLLEL